MRKWSMQELGRKSIADFKEAPKTPLVVVLDNIRSMHNVGSVFRTADSFLVEKMYLCGYTPQPPHRDINKTALGATETVAWEYTATTVEAVQTLQAQGFKVYAVEQAEGAIYLDQFDPLRKSMLRSDQSHSGAWVLFGHSTGYCCRWMHYYAGHHVWYIVADFVAEIWIGIGLYGYRSQCGHGV
jgi:hypothetical protein